MSLEKDYILRLVKELEKALMLLSSGSENKEEDLQILLKQYFNMSANDLFEKDIAFYKQNIPSELLDPFLQLLYQFVFEITVIKHPFFLSTSV